MLPIASGFLWLGGGAREKSTGASLCARTRYFAPDLVPALGNAAQYNAAHTGVGASTSLATDRTGAVGPSPTPKIVH